MYGHLQKLIFHASGRVLGAARESMKKGLPVPQESGFHLRLHGHAPSSGRMCPHLPGQNCRRKTRPSGAGDEKDEE